MLLSDFSNHTGSIRYLTGFKGRMLVSGLDNEGIWSVDPATGDSVLLAANVDGRSRRSGNPIINDEVLIFAMNDGIWRTDATPDGTVPIAQIGIVLEWLLRSLMQSLLLGGSDIFVCHG